MLAEVIFYAKEGDQAPAAGYRPDAVFCDNGQKEYWGITFAEVSAAGSDATIFAEITFTFDEMHYSEVENGQRFLIMEGSHQVGEGTILSIEQGERS